MPAGDDLSVPCLPLQPGVQEYIWQAAFTTAAAQIMSACAEAEGLPIGQAATALLPLLAQVHLVKLCPKAAQDVKHTLDYALAEVGTRPADFASAEAVVEKLRSIAAALRGQRAAYTELAKDAEDRRKAREKKSAAAAPKASSVKNVKASPSQGGFSKLYSALRHYGDEGISGCWLCHHLNRKAGGGHRLNECPDAAAAQERLKKTGSLPKKL